MKFLFLVKGFCRKVSHFFSSPKSFIQPFVFSPCFFFVESPQTCISTQLAEKANTTKGSDDHAAENACPKVVYFHSGN